MKTILCGAGEVGKSIDEKLSKEGLEVTVIDESKEHLKKILFYLENDYFPNKSDIKLNIKIISISSKNIDYEIQQGNFMKNLFDRLNVIRIKVPPISERREDIISICDYYLDYFNQNKKYNFFLSKKSSNQLEVYNWPGNVHQIINYIEKTIILFQDLNS